MIAEKDEALDMLPDACMHGIPRGVLPSELDQAAGMKTMSTGLFLSTLSLGFFVSSILVTVVHKITGQTGHNAWLADNLNQGKLYNFYWLLAAMCLVNFFLYLVAARWYVYKESRTPEDESMADVELVEAEASFAKLA